MYGRGHQSIDAPGPSVPGDCCRYKAVAVQQPCQPTCRSRRHARRAQLLWRMRLTETAMDIHDRVDDHNPDKYRRNCFQITPSLGKATVHTSAYPRPQYTIVPNPPLPCLSPTWLLQTLRVHLPITTKAEENRLRGFYQGIGIFETVIPWYGTLLLPVVDFRRRTTGTRKSIALRVGRASVLQHGGVQAVRVSNPRRNRGLIRMPGMW